MLFATHVIHERRETLLHVICTCVKPRVCVVYCLMSWEASAQEVVSTAY